MHNIQSPRTDDDAIEQEIIAKGKTAPRVTPADLAANIAECVYFSPVDLIQPESLRESSPLKLLTFCVLILRNGFTVVGKSSCASPENFDAEIGRNVARADAVQQIWPLMGYQLREQLFQAQQPPQLPDETSPNGLLPHQQRVVDEKSVLDERREKLFAFMHGSKFHATCDEVERMRLTDQYHAMTKYSEVLGERIAAFTLAQPPV